MGTSAILNRVNSGFMVEVSSLDTPCGDENVNLATSRSSILQINFPNTKHVPQ